MTRTSKPTDTGDPPPESTDGHVYVLGDAAVGAVAARRFLEDDRSVIVVDASAEPENAPAGRRDTVDLSTLDDAGVDDDSTVIVATSSDGRNLLAAQLIRRRFGVERVLVVANDPERVDAFVDAGHDPICATTALSDAIVDDA